jgi:regulator of sigma D
VNTTELNNYTQELVEQSVQRGKFIAYSEVMELLKAEADKHPTTSATTLDNLWAELGKLLGIKY